MQHPHARWAMGCGRQETTGARTVHDISLTILGPACSSKNLAILESRVFYHIYGLGS